MKIISEKCEHNNVFSNNGFVKNPTGGNENFRDDIVITTLDQSKYVEFDKSAISNVPFPKNISRAAENYVQPLQHKISNMKENEEKSY